MQFSGQTVGGVEKPCLNDHPCWKSRKCEQSDVMRQESSREPEIVGVYSSLRHPCLPTRIPLTFKWKTILPQLKEFNIRISEHFAEGCFYFLNAQDVHVPLLFCQTKQKCTHVNSITCLCLELQESFISLASDFGRKYFPSGITNISVFLEVSLREKLEEHCPKMSSAARTMELSSSGMR